MSHLSRRSLFATAVLALTTAAATAFAADGTFDKTLSLSGAPMVTVSTGAGHIHVTPGPDNQLHVIGHVHANSGWLSSGDPDAVIRQIVANPPITQTGNIINIGHTGDHQIYNNVSIDYDITAPKSTALTAHTGSGGIEVSGLSGSVSANSGSGSLHLSLLNSTDVRTRTGSGGIHIEGATGALHASTGSGSIDIAGSVNSDWNLSTGSGGIHAHLPDNAHFNLNASTGSGSVHVDQPMMMQGSINHHHVSGTVNGGGPTLHASTGSGDITIHGNGTAAQR
ncbi:MAG TPA: DUF4097 family beta strand repeat-containing protein [Acidobacteriaceae bacterium]|nr:DUF4097 family beta strand repeat-containing protein [Acidobacteriaceae bacterium]